MAQLLIDNPEACGIGRGHECCAYLLAGGEGTECGRVTSLRRTLERRARGLELPRFNAQRLPEEPYPLCQIFGDREREALPDIDERREG